jgi:hypothetical protein
VGWLALPAGLAWGLTVALSAWSVWRGRRAGSAVPRPTIVAWSGLAFAVLAVPAMVATIVRVGSGALFAILTVPCVVGVALLGVDALGRITARWLPFGVEWLGLYLFAIGFIAFHLWIAITSVAIVLTGTQPVALGWFGIATMAALLAGAAVAMASPDSWAGVDPRWNVAAYGPQVAIVAWMAWLGLSA